ncbi:hypothetical protein [Endozoicomonas sp.]|uniref:hypothetical protein n=1 Tax=Endozoicomonas sp. TaxID=1892382 RepID=UPI00383A55E2
MVDGKKYKMVCTLNKIKGVIKMPTATGTGIGINTQRMTTRPPNTLEPAAQAAPHQGFYSWGVSAGPNGPRPYVSTNQATTHDFMSQLPIPKTIYERTSAASNPQNPQNPQYHNSVSQTEKRITDSRDGSVQCTTTTSRETSISVPISDPSQISNFFTSNSIFPSFLSFPYPYPVQTHFGQMPHTPDYPQNNSQYGIPR